MGDSNLSNEIKKRRTFAIISHPDAGKTTITEKLLLYGNAIQVAGERIRLDDNGARSWDLCDDGSYAVSL